MGSKLLLVLGLLPLSCTSSLAPASDVQGTWVADFNLPGASLVLDLKQSQALIQGTGSYAIEAGRVGTLEVSGSYPRPTITLVMSFDYGHTETYTGTVRDSQHMSGIVADSAGHESTLSFTRR